MAKKNTPPEEDIFDLTELIEEGGKPAKSGAAAYARQAAVTPPAADEMDFEAALAQAASGDSGISRESDRPVNPDEKLDLSDLNDIDNILETLDIPPQPARPAKAAPPPPSPVEEVSEADDLDSVLDDLLGAPPENPPAPKREASGSNLDDDLDSILSSFDEHSEAAPPVKKPSTPSKSQTDELNIDADLDDILGQGQPSGDAGAVPEKSPAAPAASAEDLDLPDNLDELLDEGPASESAKTEDELPGNNVAPESAKEKKAELKKDLANVPEPELPRSTARLLAPQEDIAGICQNLLSSHLGSFQDAIQKLSLETGGQTAHLEDLNRTVADISKRLFATESKLSAAKAKIASLEKTVAANAGLEDLFRDGTELHAGFMNLLANAVGNAVQGVMATMQAQGVQPAQIQALAHAQEDVDGRIIQLESRFDQLEPALTARMDVVENTAARNAALLESADTTEIAKRIGALEERLATLEASVQTSMTEHVGALQNQLDELAPQLIARLDQVEAKASETGEQIQAELAGRDNSAGMEEISQKLASLEQSLASAMEEMEQKVQAAAEAGKAESRLDELQKSLEEANAVFNEKLDALKTENTEALATLKAELGGIDKSGEITKLAQKLKSLETSLAAKIEDVEKQAAQAMAAGESSDLAAQITDLGKKVDSLASNIDARVAEAEAKTEEKVAQIEAEMTSKDCSSQLGDLLGQVKGLEEAFAARFAQIEKNIADTGSSTGETENRLTAMREALDNLSGALDVRIAEAETKADENIRQLREETVKADNGLQFTELANRIDELEKTFGERIEAVQADAARTASDMEKEQAEETNAKLHAMQKQLDDFTALAASHEATDSSLALLAERIDALEQGSAASDLGQLENRVAQSEEFSSEAGKKLARLASAEQSVNARVDSLEIRLDKLEPNFNIQIEKAAAATVARILNEEIRKLAGNQ